VRAQLQAGVVDHVEHPLAEARPPRLGPQRGLERLELAFLVRTPDADRDRTAGPRHPCPFAQRDDRVVGELERVEARDGVEGRLGPGQALHRPDAQVGAGRGRTRDPDHRGRAVDPAHARAALARQRAEAPRAAADVEYAHPLAQAERVGDHALGGCREAGPVLGEGRRFVVPEVHGS
jgi:hypothetical protein